MENFHTDYPKIEFKLAKYNLIIWGIGNTNTIYIKDTKETLDKFIKFLNPTITENGEFKDAEIDNDKIIFYIKLKNRETFYNLLKILNTEREYFLKKL